MNPVAARRADAERTILEATLADPMATLAVVVATEGSTYVHAGALALFGAAQVGWLSGGCLEGEIARRAAAASARRGVDWLEIDTRDDEALFSGSATGCRGRLCIALLPLAAFDDWASVARAWLARRGELELAIDGAGEITARCAQAASRALLDVAPMPWPDPASVLRISVVPPPGLIVFGAGPEVDLLVPLLRATGWFVDVVERRPRWLPAARVADRVIECAPAAALASGETRADAALVMHHHFELDREALEALAPQPIAFVGLLG
ncbi:MAG: XdhC family protein, partial [Xanthomonadales bacterium]|nr:XdhC family protein [Xanthomonadales bacterium]